MTTDATVLATRLREARTTLGLRQRDTAEAIGIGRSAVAEIELGRRQVTGLELRRLARLYRRSIDWLVGATEPATLDPDLAAAMTGLTPHDRDLVVQFARFLDQLNRQPTSTGATA